MVGVCWGKGVWHYGGLIIPGVFDMQHTWHIPPKSDKCFKVPGRYNFHVEFHWGALWGFFILDLFLLARDFLPNRHARASTRFGMDVSLSMPAFAGCPQSSIKGKDTFSDREAIKLFNPRYLKSSNFDDPGWNILQLLETHQCVFNLSYFTFH